VSECPRLAGVFAHPDDDVYQIGGSVALHQEALELTVVVCTSGDAGPIWVPELATRETLGAVRESEERAALAAVGAPDADVRFLRHADWHLPEVPFEELVDEIEAVLDEVEPHVVVTFGPDGMTSHHDHVRAGQAATAAFERVRERRPALQRLYHTALARSDVDRFSEGVRELDPASRHGYSLFHLVGVPDEQVAVRVDTRGVRARKLEGILAHRTQIGEWEQVPEPVRWIFLDAECFVRAWPPEHGGGPTLGDLFETLELDPARS
jgi:N-acetyl-1-D-myo-inositol-2-amino-2-deoxy-alpha-D-glucopyranoside deacetylase